MRFTKGNEGVLHNFDLIFVIIISKNSRERERERERLNETN